MPHSAATRRTESTKSRRVRSRRTTESRYTVALTPDVIPAVEQYAKTVDASMSKAIATLVRLGLESQESRKREFFQPQAKSCRRGPSATRSPGKRVSDPDSWPLINAQNSVGEPAPGEMGPPTRTRRSKKDFDGRSFRISGMESPKSRCSQRPLVQGLRNLQVVRKRQTSQHIPHGRPNRERQTTVTSLKNQLS